MSAASKAKTAKERATIAIRMMKSNKSGSFSRAFDDCFEMGDSDQVVEEIARRAMRNAEIMELVKRNRGVAWSSVALAITKLGNAVTCDLCERPRALKMLFCEEHVRSEQERFLNEEENDPLEAWDREEEANTSTGWHTWTGKDGKRTVVSNNRRAVDVGSEADAEFIVRAVNSHEELLNALKQTLDALFNETTENSSCWINTVKIEALKAVAKAEGKGAVS